jgi:hypothetical protein
MVRVGLMTRTAADIIEAKGGPIAFAQKIGASVDEVRVWKTRNRIPRTRWLEVHEAYRDLTRAVLEAANPPRASRRRQEA